MRLNRFLASCGLGSRRACEEIVAQGRVFINGEPVSNLATRVSDGDVVQVDGRKVRASVATTIILKKPPGFLCTRHDELEEGRDTIYELLPENLKSLHYVGRLDKDSEGLLILTNSGDLTEKLTHPRHGIEKEYLVAVDRVFDAERDRAAMLQGFDIEGGFARAVAIGIEAPRVISIVLTQGIKRQIRLMFEHLGYEVRRLERIRIGAFTAPELKTGRWRVLTENEIRQLSDRFLPGRSKPARKRSSQSSSSATAENRQSRAPSRRADDSQPDRNRH